MNTTFIYGLFDPTTNKIRYIGKANNPYHRLRQHVYNANHNIKTNLHIFNWIRRLLRDNHRPIIKILEETSTDNWKEAEIKWIKYYRDSGENLVNIAAGGIAPEVTEETRKRISQGRIGHKHSEETKRKLSLMSMGRQANLGNKHSQETKDKISKSKAGKKQTQEHIKNVLESKKGYRHSEETKAKIGASNSIASKGKIHTDEHKRKIGEGVRRHFLEIRERIQDANL